MPKKGTCLTNCLWRQKKQNSNINMNLSISVMRCSVTQLFCSVALQNLLIPRRRFTIEFLQMRYVDAPHQVIEGARSSRNNEAI